MKSKILFAFGIWLGSLWTANSQNVSDFSWFSDDAQWYYGIADDGMGSGVGCIHMSVAGDTLLQGRKCRKLMIEACDGAYETIYEYVYSDSEKLYYYNLEADDFFLLLDFSAKAGDTVWVHRTSFVPNPGFDPYQRWKMVVDEVENPYPFMAYVIKAVDAVEMGGQSLRRQSVEPVRQRMTNEDKEDSWWMFPGWSAPYNYIVENIGSLGGFWGETYGLYPEWGTCWLRCFSMDGKTYLTDGQCDNVGTEKHSDPIKVCDVFLDDHRNALVIEGLEENGVQLELYDILGKRVLAVEVDGSTIDVSKLPAGGFLYRLQKNGKVLQAGKIVKSL